MTIDLAAEQTRQNNLFNEVVAAFTAAREAFEDTVTNPGSGFDLEAWLNLLPTVSLRVATVSAISNPASYHGNDIDPNVTKPTLITPSAITALSEGAYDSAYLEAMEQEIRTLTADIIIQVLPVSLRNAYFNRGNIQLARVLMDDIDSIKSAEGERGFPSAPMRLARLIGERTGQWQDKNYAKQNEVAKERLDLANKLYFESINSGIKIEDIRSRVILEYSKLYGRHNITLSGYYDQLVSEKTAEAKLALDNISSKLRQEQANVSMLQQDNTEEVELPETIYQRAIKRLDNEFLIDKELVERRQVAMKKIVDVYAGWMTATVGGLQTTITAKHNTTAT